MVRNKQFQIEHMHNQFKNGMKGLRFSPSGLRDAIIRKGNSLWSALQEMSKSFACRSRGIYIAWQDVQAWVLQANSDQIWWRKTFSV